MIRDFIAQDMLDIIGSGAKEESLKLYGHANLKELAEETESDGLSFTGVVDDKIVGCGGVRILWPNVGEVWMMLSPDVDGYPIVAWEAIKGGFEKIVQENDFVRLQGWCRVGFVKAHTVFKHLGFEPEGTAKKYTPDGVDCILYGKVK